MTPTLMNSREMLEWADNCKALEGKKFPRNDSQQRGQLRTGNLMVVSCTRGLGTAKKDELDIAPAYVESPDDQSPSTSQGNFLRILSRYAHSSLC